MPIIGYLFIAIANVLELVLNLVMFAILARAVLSWVSPDPYNPIVRFIHSVTEPILHPVRTRLPLSYGGFDLSPIVVFLVIIFLKSFLGRSLEYIGKTMF